MGKWSIIKWYVLLTPNNGVNSETLTASPPIHVPTSIPAQSFFSFFKLPST